MLSGSAFLSFLGCRIVVEYSRPGPRPDLSPGYSYTSSQVGAIQLILTTAIIASLLIAVHRFVILGEVADRPIWRVSLAYRRFAGWLALLSLPWLGPIAAGVLFGPVHPFLNVLFSLLSLIFAAIASLRLMLLLPAVAVAPQSADWRNAWRDSRGHAWKFVGAQIVACPPLIVVAAIDIWIRGVGPVGGGTLLLSATEASALQLLMVYLGAAVASRLFQNYGAP
jgi:hypothetical protein